MAKSFTGLLLIDFETDIDVDPEQFKKFRNAFNKIVEDHWELDLYELAESYGFDITTAHPIMEDYSYPLEEQH